MMLQTNPAQTFGYLVMGFSVILVLLGLYVLSLWTRARRLRRAMTRLEAEGEPDPRGS